MTTKKPKTESGEKNSQKKKKNTFSLGTDDANKHASSDASQLKLKNEGDNLIALLSADYCLRRVHWLLGPDGQKFSVLCGVHATDDDEKISQSFSSGADCPICERVERIYRDTKEDKESPVNKQLRIMAAEIKAGHEFQFIATRGEADVSRVNGTKIIKPYFDKIVPMLLGISKASFGKFQAAWQREGFKSADAVGLPVNFFKEKIGNKKFAEVTKVVFYPKDRVKSTQLTDLTLPEFDSTVYDQEAALQAAEILDAQLSEQLGDPKYVAKGKRG